MTMPSEARRQELPPETKPSHTFDQALDHRTQKLTMYMSVHTCTLRREQAGEALPDSRGSVPDSSSQPGLGSPWHARPPGRGIPWQRGPLH